ncbi:hypothetical protein O3M35_006292 [Rhynocoris fuscipes]|uniref:NADH dehydrogenase [ubiquinone] 1 alpha subcomplex subunit 9, mitochondrial n=1 Tax=Rhynocoris fuscipes TaxID=488301 RepID=A0AAW1DDG3_9HEMI
MSTFVRGNSELLKRIQTSVGRQVYCWYSSDFHPLERSSLTDLKRGTGGRCSFNGMVATVFGASGFLGRHVVNKLGKMGTQIIIAHRGELTEVNRLRVAADLGQVLIQPYNLKDENSIRKCIKYSNVVINLVGRDWQTKNYSFAEVHVIGARRIARLCKEACIPTLVHMSALNATPFPAPYMLRNGSQFLQSKWEGEEAVREEFPDAIIFRPADMVGQEDRFTRYYCSLWRHNMKALPLYKKGTATEKQPVHVSDVAAGILIACQDRCWHGRTIQAVGPRRYLLSELVDWFHRLTRRTWKEWGYFRYNIRYDPIFQLWISILPCLTLGHPLGNLHWEKVEREAHSDVIDNEIETLKDLGVELTLMEDQVPWELKPYRLYSYAEKENLEFDVVEPPPFIECK